VNLLPVGRLGPRRTKSAPPDSEHHQQQQQQQEEEDGCTCRSQMIHTPTAYLAMQRKISAAHCRISCFPSGREKIRNENLFSLPRRNGRSLAAATAGAVHR